MLKKKSELIHKTYYSIPLNEKLKIYTMRVFVLGSLFIRLKLKKIIPFRFNLATEVFQYYFPKYELPYMKKKLSITSDDTTAAVKIATYFHTLTGVTGHIEEMSPDKSVRVEYKCPLQNKVSQDFCCSVLSLPVFTALCGELNENIEHRHTKYLSGGDSVCKLVFEMKGGNSNAL